MNRKEYLEKVMTFGRGWWADIGEHWTYHLASALLGAFWYIVLKFFLT